jgi:hypothetical protein
MRMLRRDLPLVLMLRRFEIELALNALDQCGPFSRLVSVKGIKHGIHPENARCRRL